MCTNYASVSNKSSQLLLSVVFLNVTSLQKHPLNDSQLALFWCECQLGLNWLTFLCMFSGQLLQSYCDKDLFFSDHLHSSQSCNIPLPKRVKGTNLSGKADQHDHIHIGVQALFKILQNNNLKHKCMKWIKLYSSTHYSQYTRWQNKTGGLC